MLFASTNPVRAACFRLIGLAVIAWTVFASSAHAPSTHGRGLVVLIAFAVCAVAWLVWTAWSNRVKHLTPDVFVVAAAGGLLSGAEPASAASAFVFVAATVAGIRVGLLRALPVVATGIVTLALSGLIYGGSGLGLLAYSLGFLASALGASNLWQSLRRAEQSELLLAQAQRSHEEQVRAARLEETARVARDIHDVLAHSLAGLAIQLEATSALVEQGAERDVVLRRLHDAHQLARQGLHETRRAVGALRGEPDEATASAEIEALVSAYGADTEAPAVLHMEVLPAGLAGPAGEAAVRVIQEALTNVRKHAPGAAVEVRVEADGGGLRIVVEDTPPAGAPVGALAGIGGGYGLAGMRERAELLRRGTRRRSGRRPLARRDEAAGGRDSDRFGVSGDIRVLIADDQALVREGLTTLLGATPGVTPVGAAANGEEALALAHRHRPDVVLMDLRMPIMDGVEATRRIRLELEDVEVVVLTTHADEASILDALRAGARGYLTKDAGIAEISRALQAAAAHQALLDPLVQQRLLAATVAGASGGSTPAAAPGETLPDGLTPREAEVLRLVASGLSNGEIAAALVVSEATVKSHINHLFAKIGARDRAQAVHYAYSRGLVSGR